MNEEEVIETLKTMKENSISYKTAKQETERLICEIEEITITHRAYTAECLRRVLKENEELKSNNEKYIIHLTDEQYKTVIENAQNDINQKWIQKVKDKIEEYKNMLKTCNKAKDIDRIKAINERILELQELLEGRK